ncbi:putative disease resistance protein RGA1 [Pistacia vera]|uniref:putative disease resistance protein RGA1 n=1 Tax=Pistacia vera TaxID=55513 RepID=UPI001262CA92|nr:putative disease resistance protein RGA1 [Pistacia vera]
MAGNEPDWSRLCKELFFSIVKLRTQDVVSTSANGKKFCLVLDDVWSESHVNWNDLRELLINCATGSETVVTTCSNQVASIIGTVPAYVLKGLSPEDFMPSFVKSAFKEGVVRTLGSVLYQNICKHDWMLIKDSDKLRLLEQGTGYILPC